MDSEKYHALVLYLTTGKYPIEMTKESHKVQLRKLCQSFVVKDGELYHLRDGRMKDDADKQVVDSQKVIIADQSNTPGLFERATDRIIHDIHTADDVGEHLSVAATKEKVAEQFWWPGYASEVTEMVRKCEVCRANAPPHRAMHSERMRNVWANRRMATDPSGTTPSHQLSRTSTMTKMDDEADSTTPNKAKRQRLGYHTPSHLLSASEIKPPTPGGSSSSGSNQAMKKSVLILQHQVYQSQLEYQTEKRGTMEKFNLALDEFRRHLAEQRLVARGVSVSNVPLDIPPGMEQFQM